MAILMRRIDEFGIPNKAKEAAEFRVAGGGDVGWGLWGICRE